MRLSLNDPLRGFLPRVSFISRLISRFSPSVDADAQTQDCRAPEWRHSIVNTMVGSTG